MLRPFLISRNYGTFINSDEMIYHVDEAEMSNFLAISE